MEKLFLIAALSLNVFSQAMAMEIQDPHYIMDDIEMFATARDFKYEFKVGDMVKVESNSCWSSTDADGNEESGCDTEYKVQEIVKVEKEYAVYSSKYAITKNSYNQIKKNPFKLLTDFEEFKGLMAKESLSEEKSTLVLTGANEEYSLELGVQTMKIKFTIVYEGQDGTFAFPMYMVIAQDLPIAGQIAEFGIDKDLWPIPANWKPSLKVVDWLKFI